MSIRFGIQKVDLPLWDLLTIQTDNGIEFGVKKRI